MPIILNATVGIFKNAYSYLSYLMEVLVSSHMNG